MHAGKHQQYCTVGYKATHTKYVYVRVLTALYSTVKSSPYFDCPDSILVHGTFTISIIHSSSSRNDNGPEQPAHLGDE